MVANEKPARGGLFLFSLYKFRIANPGGFTARFSEVFWRGRPFVSAIVTLVWRGEA
jgi:hypothetical protein